MVIVNKTYSNNLKKKLCTDICCNGNSTIKTAEANGVPLKTLEKWVTAFYKNPQCFDGVDSYQNSNFKIINPPSPISAYDDLDIDQLKTQLMKKDIEIARLKKGYSVEGGGMEKKVFVSLSTKNMK